MGENVLNNVMRCLEEADSLIIIQTVPSFTHPSCNLSATVLRGSKRPCRVGTPPQRSVVFL